MRARFITDTATVDVNPVEVKGSINVEPNIIKGNVSVSSASGTNKHDKLINRDLSDQHPIGAITGLQEALDDKQGVLTAGEGISIENGVISNTQTSAEWGNIQGDVNDQVDLKNELDGKQDTISDLLTIRTNAEHGESAYNAVNEYGDIVTHNVNEFATSSQGALADTALQTGDNVSSLVNDSGYITGINSADVTTALGYIPYDSNNPDNYTSNIGTVTSVNNVSPDNNGNVSITLPDPQIQSDWNQSDDTALDYIKNKPTIPSGVIVDQVYDDTSTNPQSGVAIAGAGFITSSSLPTVNNATLTIQKNSTTVDTFTANASVDKTINLVIPTTASDVGALSSLTKYAAGLSLTINSSTFVVTGQLKDQDGNNLGSAQTIDLPLESVVVNGSYDSENKKVILTLENGSTIEFSVADLVAGLQSEITENNKLAADLVDDSTSSNKFVTTSEKSLISSALQPNDNISNLINDAGYISGIDSSDVTTALGYTPVNSSDLASVATSGSYNDLSNKPSIPTATSDLTNDSGFLTSADLSTIESDIEDLQDANKVINVVSTYAELQSYNTSTVTKNSIIKVIADETNNGKTSWYQWSSQGAGTAFVQPTLTADGTLGGADFACACDSTYNRGGNPDYAWHAFDGRTNVSTTYPSSFWNSGSGQPHWIEFYNPQPLEVTNIKIYNGESGSVAKDWQFQCSDNGSTWTTITSGTNTTTGQGADWSFNVAGSGSHKYYRFLTTSAQGSFSAHTTIAEIEITATEGGSYSWVKINEEGKYLTGITSGDVTTALGYTPYNSSNPSGYTSNVGTVTSVNNVSPDGNGNVSISIPAAQIQSDWTQSDNTKVDFIKNKPSLATVATSGSYSDLSNKPTIPAAQVNSDWNAVSGVAEILNKPSLATVATSGSYNDLSNKPTIPTVNNATLTIQKNSTNVATFTANASSNVTADISVPTKVSDLSNDSGFITGISSSDVTTALGYTPADDSDVVKTSGNQTIDDIKTFTGHQKLRGNTLKRVNVARGSTPTSNQMASIYMTDSTENNGDNNTFGLIRTQVDTSGNVQSFISAFKNITAGTNYNINLVAEYNASEYKIRLGGNPLGTDTNGSLSTVTNSTANNTIPTMGWVNNPSTSTNVVHRTGTETIGGDKTFSNQIKATLASYSATNTSSNASPYKKIGSCVLTGTYQTVIIPFLYSKTNANITDSTYLGKIILRTEGTAGTLNANYCGIALETYPVFVQGGDFKFYLCYKNNYPESNQVTCEIWVYVGGTYSGVNIMPMRVGSGGANYSTSTMTWGNNLVESATLPDGYTSKIHTITDVYAKTQTSTDNSNKIATTAFVKSNLTDYVTKSSVYYDSTTSTLYIG